VSRKQKKAPAAPATGNTQVCDTCGKAKPVTAFRWLRGGARQPTCRRCRPEPPIPAWKAARFAAEAARQQAKAEAAARRRAKAEAQARAPWWTPRPAPSDAAARAAAEKTVDRDA